METLPPEIIEHEVLVHFSDKDLKLFRQVDHASKSLVDRTIRKRAQLVQLLGKNPFDRSFKLALKKVLPPKQQAEFKKEYELAVKHSLWRVLPAFYPNYHTQGISVKEFDSAVRKYILQSSEGQLYTAPEWEWTLYLQTLADAHPKSLQIALKLLTLRELEALQTIVK